MSKDIFENLVTDITAKVLEQVQQQINPVVINAVINFIISVVNTKPCFLSISRKNSIIVLRIVSVGHRKLVVLVWMVSNFDLNVDTSLS